VQTTEVKLCAVDLGVKSQDRLALLFKLGEAFLVVAGDPAGRGVFDRLVGDLHAVVGLEAGHGHVELEDADRAERSPLREVLG
jgi:hypothetical protein